mgnify:CR=1 FL=1
MANESNIEPDDIKSIPTFRAAYSDRTALLMAKLAYRAYEKFDKDDDAFGAFQQDFTRLGLVDCTGLVDSDVGTAGYVAAGPDLIVVAFRGTENLLDWWTNMNVAWVVLQGGVKVHTGFFQAYHPIRDALFAKIEQLLKAKPRPVYVTGHSLGGALAVMATAECGQSQRGRGAGQHRGLLHVPAARKRATVPSINTSGCRSIVLQTASIWCLRYRRRSRDTSTLATRAISARWEFRRCAAHQTSSRSYGAPHGDCGNS